MQKKKLKIIVAPDSFKGTMTSSQAGTLIQHELKIALPDSEIIRFSIADGGENTIDAFKENLNGSYVKGVFTSPDFEKAKFKYLRLKDTAAIEAGQCAGLGYTKIKNPLYTTSYGMGEQIRDAISKGAKNIFIALGGSATHDGGAGLLSALGVKFMDADKNEFIPTGRSLKDICQIDISNLRKNIAGTAFTLLADVTNPLYGKNGAAYVYAKQKGATTDEEINLLEEGLRHFAEITKQSTDIDISKVHGGGAAGGIGAGCYGFLNAKIQSGIDTVLDLCNFDSALTNADLVITGEGNFDAQSMMGKTISGIARRTVKKNIPLVIFAGRNEFHSQEFLKQFHIQKVYELASPDETFEEIKKNCETDLRRAVRNFLQEF